MSLCYASARFKMQPGGLASIQTGRISPLDGPKQVKHRHTDRQTYTREAKGYPEYVAMNNAILKYYYMLFSFIKVDSVRKLLIINVSLHVKNAKQIFNLFYYLCIHLVMHLL